MKMKAWKRALLFALCLLPAAIIGGWFAAETTLPTVDQAALETAVEQAGSLAAVKAASALSIAVYALACGFFGYLLAEKIGLMRSFRFEKTILLRVLLISAAGGALLSLDAWTFGSLIPQLKASYASSGSFDAAVWIASILYGGVIEEVMLRLFFMSLLSLAGWKLFFRKEASAPVRVLIGANVLSALAFAAGHLPVTAQTFGNLTFLLVFRCFLLNGAAGLLFGRFYRKYGLQYAILGHMLFHIVSRTVWLIAF